MKMIKNNKQVRVWLETVLAYFKILFGHLLEQKFQSWHDTQCSQIQTSKAFLFTNTCKDPVFPNETNMEYHNRNFKQHTQQKKHGQY